MIIRNDFQTQMLLSFYLKQFGKTDIGLFASFLNTKCSWYRAYKPGPNACQVDAFLGVGYMLTLSIPSIQFNWKSTDETVTRSGDSLAHITMLATTAMFHTVCSVCETWYNTTVDSSAQVPARSIRSKSAATNMGSSEFCSRRFFRNLSKEGCH